MFSIWINIILSLLDGYSAHNTYFLALGKVLLTYVWRWLAKYSIILFLLFLWGYGTKCHVYSLLGQTEGKWKVFFKKGREG